MKLLPNESVVHASKDKSLTVTNLRVIKTTRTFSRSTAEQIPFPQLAAVKVVHHRPLWLILIAILIGVGGHFGAKLLLNHWPEQVAVVQFGTYATYGLAGLAVLLFFLLRRQGLAFESSGGSQIQHVTRVGLLACKDLMALVEEVRSNYPKGLLADDHLSKGPGGIFGKKLG